VPVRAVPSPHTPVPGRGALRRLRRGGVSALSAAALSVSAVTGLVALAPAAGASTGDEYGFLAHLNGLRAAHGLGSLTMTGDLTSIARQHSQAMAGQGRIVHNPGLTSAVSNWQVVGENVGMGPSVGSLDQAFDNSPEHYANETNRAYTQVGIGAVTDGRGEIFVTLDFRDPMYGGAPAPAPAPVAARAPIVRTPTPAAPAPVAAPVSTAPVPAKSIAVPGRAAAPAHTGLTAPSASTPRRRTLNGRPSGPARLAKVVGNRSGCPCNELLRRAGEPRLEPPCYKAAIKHGPGERALAWRPSTRPGAGQPKYSVIEPVA